HILVEDYRYRPIDKGYQGLLAFQMLVSFVFGVYADRSITQYRLWPCSGDHEPFISSTFYFIANLVELRLHFAVDHLLVGEGRLRLGIPVHHAVAAVDV